VKVRSIEPLVAELVTMEDDREFRRQSAGCWEELMGMSWEDISHCCEVHEAAYQAAKASADNGQSAAAGHSSVTLVRVARDALWGMVNAESPAATQEEAGEIVRKIVNRAILPYIAVKAAS
jgi:hypothetical protein